MKAGFFVHSPCATQVSHLMSSSAHVPSPALAASAASHQPHARRHVAAMKRRLRTQCSSLAHPAHLDVVSVHDGSAGWRSATAGRRVPGEAGADTHALQLRRHSSLMKAGFFVHSPCATQVSHLMSSSAHVPSPALAASAASHQPHARRHVAAMKRRLRTQCSSLAHPAHFSSSTHGAGRPSRQRSHESGHSSRMKAWLSWHCPLLIQYSQSAEASEHRPVMTISSPARTAWKMSRLEFSLMCLPADRGRDARSTHPCSHNQLRGNSRG